MKTGNTGRCNFLSAFYLFFALALVLEYSCVKRPPIAFPANSRSADGPAEIFKDDFPFYVSEKTEDLSLLAPKARKGCKVKVLPDGVENFALRDSVMEKAQKSLEIQTYIFANDEIGKRTFELMREKNRQGAKTRLIIDTGAKFGKKSREFFDEIKASGVEFAGYEPKWKSFFSPNYMPSAIEMDMRYHEKYLVVDNAIGIVGGTNIAEEYAGRDSKKEKAVRDQDVLLTGPVVDDLRRAFEQNFRDLKYLEGSRPVLIRRLFKTDAKIQDDDISSRPVSSDDRFEIKNFTDENVTARLIRSRPKYGETYIYQSYIYLLNSARKNVLIVNSYYIPDKTLNDAVINAARRGVNVSMVIDVGKAKDALQIQPVITRHYYKPLVDAGVRVYEWQPTIHGGGALHAKVAVFDDRVSIIGSYNLDPRCKLLNTENIVVMDSEKVAGALTDYIHENDLPKSELVSAQKAKNYQYPKQPWALIRLSWAMTIKDHW